MDQWLFSYAQLTKEHFLQADENCPGAGAAGGLGFAFQSYLGARLEPGIRIVLEETGLEREMADADFVLTGEGRMDEQTAMGKAPAGVAKLAKSMAVRCSLLPEHCRKALQPAMRSESTQRFAFRKGSQPGRGDGSGRCDAKSDGYLQRGVPAGESCRGCSTMRQYSMSHIAGVVPQ